MAAPLLNTTPQLTLNMAAPLLDIPPEVKNIIWADLGANDILNLRLVNHELKDHVDANINRSKHAAAVMETEHKRLSWDIEKRKQDGIYLGRLINYCTMMGEEDVPADDQVKSVETFVEHSWNDDQAPSFLKASKRGWARFSRMLLEMQLERTKAEAAGEVEQQAELDENSEIPGFRDFVNRLRLPETRLNSDVEILDIRRLADTYLKLLAATEREDGWPCTLAFVTKRVVTDLDIPAIGEGLSGEYMAARRLVGDLSRRKLHAEFGVPVLTFGGGNRTLAFCNRNKWAVAAIERLAKCEEDEDLAGLDDLVKAAIVEKMYVFF